MAERKSVNKYYPPDWDPSKGSINNYVGQHPLRDRAKKLGQGILVIRFEMPYNIWCGGCKAHIGMGVRYNAEKSKTGNYYSTPIYKFRMKCHLCDNYFEIQTDPKNHDYVILDGARRKEQRWDPKENEQIVPEDKATQKKLATDAMFKLEHGTDDKKRGKQAVSNLALLESSKEIMKEDYMLNKMARNMFREEKKQLKKVREDDDALLKKSSLDIPLLEEKEEDIKLAGLIRLRAVETYDEKQAQKRKYIESRPMFLARKRPLDTAADLPHAKKLKIIKDNILKAKVNASTSPFDRRKTTTLGIGLTKNQLGIRQKSSCNLISLQKQNESEDVDKTNLNDSTHLIKQNSEVDRNTDINYSKSSHTSNENKDSEIDNQRNKTYFESGTKHLEHSCLNNTSVCDASSTFVTNEPNKCMNDEKNKTETYNKELNNKCSTDLHEISTIESKTQSTNEGPLVEGNIEINTQNNKPVAQPSLSLVAAYSDSEDTDASAG